MLKSAPRDTGILQPLALTYTALNDWKEAVAGQRVQIIKPDPQHTGVLEFGTELVAAEDRSLVALLGASPGAFLHWK